MKFDFCKEQPPNTFYPQYHFKFSLSEDEIRKVYHKFGHTPEWFRGVFDDFNSSPNEHPYKMYASLRILQEAVKDENVDLGINYKQKYEELVELLKPHKLEDDMSPATTLKMILKYHK